MTLTPMDWVALAACWGTALVLVWPAVWERPEVQLLAARVHCALLHGARWVRARRVRP